MMLKVVNNSSFALPSPKTSGASGLDLRANIDQAIVLKPLERVLIPTGLRIAIPDGHEGQVRARSGLALKHGITLANGLGTIDSDYRGEIGVILINLGEEDYIIDRGDRIAQLIIIRYETIQLKQVEYLDETERGDGGFGHTGY